MSRRVKMSAVDTAWLRMDRPQNLMMICGVLLFDGAAVACAPAQGDRGALRRLQAVPRAAARCAPARRSGRPTAASTSSATSCARNCRGRRARRELQAFVSRLAVTPLDPAQPAVAVPARRAATRGSALVARIHHCYADGIALVRVMLSMTDAGPDGPTALPFEQQRSEAHRRSTILSRNCWDRCPACCRPRAKSGAAIVDKGAGRLAGSAARRSRWRAQGTAFTAEIAKLVLMPTGFARRASRARRGSTKRVRWTDPLPLADVKAIGHALGASVNDVLLSCVAGALRGYLADKGDATDGVMLRALVPVNLRPLEKAYKLGNQFGLVFLDLPIGIENPDRAAVRRARQHARAQGIVPAGARARLAGRDGVGAEAVAGRAARRRSRATRRA